jgi:prephenate dehydrogenase
MLRNRLGLIGGSVALDLKHQLNVRVLGADASVQHCDLAAELGLVHGISSLESGLDSADIVVIAIPVDRIEALLPEILDRISKTL